MKKIKVLFIGGSGRSGSTLLDLILGQVEGCFSLGEMHHLWERGFLENQLCGCGKPFKSCEFWTRVITKAFGGFDRIDYEFLFTISNLVERTRHVPQLMIPAFRTRKFRDYLEKYICVLEQLYTAIAETADSDMLIESSKKPSRALILKNVPNIDLYIIHLIRDSRAVVYSWQRKKRRPEIYWEKAYMPQYGVFKATREWVIYNVFLSLLGNTTKYKLINYETFTAKPKNVIADILSWSGMNVANIDNVFLNNHAVHLGINHTVSGNPVRFKRERIEIYPDNEWKSKLLFHKRALTTILTYPLLRYYYKSET